MLCNASKQAKQAKTPHCSSTLVCGRDERQKMKWKKAEEGTREREREKEKEKGEGERTKREKLNRNSCVKTATCNKLCKAISDSLNAAQLNPT
ncbi:uncharacterized protein K452DRAFT_283139 [Aplosporella prunicola CBS 121167]|uniref:Uncharacterized protein n=1 Tax=Aplosporella prunicola CBS 121167 TaxID=1176127 RepID=A0A6A6BVQ0_9PEZI|nr:uncharacterized protein K452DRAFT_283139 [Aplosporella prunicola CBS 121167]KAF2146937.1 hypothetical protein K452DRAFT_283139 [Aplosporella prunicola CBS 121167]